MVAQQAEPVTRTISVYGRTAPARQVEIKAETSGRVLTLGIARGEPATAGRRRSDARTEAYFGSGWTTLQGFLVGIVLLLGFSLPPLVQLKNVPAVRVIRRETEFNVGSSLSYAAGAAAFSWKARATLDSARAITETDRNFMARGG